MPSSKKIAKLVVDKAKSALANLPTKEPSSVTRRAAVMAMTQEIRDAMAKGYTLEEVIKILAQTDKDLGGLSLSTTRSYLKSDRTKTRKKREKANVAAASAAAPKAPKSDTKPATPKATAPGTSAGLSRKV